MRVEEARLGFWSGFTSPPPVVVDFLNVPFVPLLLCKVVAEAEASGWKCTLCPLAFSLIFIFAFAFVTVPACCFNVLVELCELPGGDVDTLLTTELTCDKSIFSGRSSSAGSGSRFSSKSA